jgi:hypothetical protein
MSDTDKLACSKCGGTMVIVRARQDQARPEYEKQKLECVECGEIATRTVDAAGRPIR